MPKSIKDSLYGDFFSEQEDDVFLLDEKESIVIWESFIDKWADNYYRLADSHWIDLNKGEIIAKWDIDFNNGFIDRIKSILEENLRWDDKDTIWFCINKCSIIKCSWFEFKQKWISFFYCEYDGVIILNEFKISQVLIVLSNDYIYVIDRPANDKNLV